MAHAVLFALSPVIRLIAALLLLAVSASRQQGVLLAVHKQLDNVSCEKKMKNLLDSLGASSAP